jgi:hypothetical protein
MKTRSASVLALLALTGCVAPPVPRPYVRRNAPPPYQQAEAQQVAQSDLRQSLADQETKREQAQGGRVVHMSLDGCYKVNAGIPGAAFPLAPISNLGEVSDTNPYLTPQENWCEALGRGQESPANNTFPGFLPEGARATYLGDGRWQITR